MINLSNNVAAARLRTSLLVSPMQTTLQTLHQIESEQPVPFILPLQATYHASQLLMYKSRRNQDNYQLATGFRMLYLLLY